MIVKMESEKDKVMRKGADLWEKMESDRGLGSNDEGEEDKMEVNEAKKRRREEKQVVENRRMWMDGKE